MLSKTFDNGMICASEQAVIVDECLANDFERIMKENNCYFLNEEETKKVSDYVINPQKQAVNPAIVGKSANWIAEQAGVKVPDKTKILIAYLPDVGPGIPSQREALPPVLAYFKVKDWHQGFEYAQKMLDLGGLGHSAVIHSTNNDLITLYGETMKVGRVISNSPSSQGRHRRYLQHQHPVPDLGLRLLWPQLHYVQRFLRKPDQQEAHRKEES